MIGKLVQVPGWAILAREHKEAWIGTTRGRERPEETAAGLVPEWDGLPIGLFLIMHGDRAEVMNTLAAVVRGLGPDAVTFVSDTLIGRFDPDDEDDREPARRIAEGEAQLSDLRREGGEAAAKIKDNMVAIRCDRAGRIEGWVQPYSMDGESVVWHNNRCWPIHALGPDVAEFKLTGYMPETIQEIMTKVVPIWEDPPLRTLWDGASKEERDQIRRSSGRALFQIVHERGHVGIPFHPDFKDLGLDDSTYGVNRPRPPKPKRRPGMKAAKRKLREKRRGD